MPRTTHLILGYRLGVPHVLSFHADLRSRLDFLSDVHVGIVTASHLNDDQTRSESIVAFGKCGRLSAQVVFRFSAAKRNGFIYLYYSLQFRARCKRRHRESLKSERLFFLLCEFGARQHHGYVSRHGEKSDEYSVGRVSKHERPVAGNSPVAWCD